MQILKVHLDIFIAYAAARGMDQELMRKMLPDPEAPLVTEAEFWTIINYIVQNLGDLQLGIRVGNFMSLGSLGLIYKLSLHCSTVAEAMFYLQNYIAETLPVVQIAVSQTEESVTLVLTLKSDLNYPAHILMESLLTIIAKEFRLMSRDAIDVGFTSPKWHQDYPANWAYNEFHTLTVGHILLNSKLRSHSSWKLEKLVPAYLTLIETCRNNYSFTARVKITILHLAEPALPPLCDVAKNLHLNPRTLQRQLAAEGCTYRQLIDELNKQLATFMSRHEIFRTSDVAAILGYSEPAAYIRAFQRWHGCSPRRFNSFEV